MYITCVYMYVHAYLCASSKFPMTFFIAKQYLELLSITLHSITQLDYNTVSHCTQVYQ